MTPPAPILEAIPALRGAIYRSLTALTTRPVAWLQAAQGASRPLIIYQEQSGGGEAVKSVGMVDWSGLVTVRSLADSQIAAEQLLSTAAPGMTSLSAPGYVITTSYERPITIPPTVDGVWFAAHQWRVSISRS